MYEASAGKAGVREEERMIGARAALTGASWKEGASPARVSDLAATDRKMVFSCEGWDEPAGPTHRTQEQVSWQTDARNNSRRCW